MDEKFIYLFFFTFPLKYKKMNIYAPETKNKKIPSL